MFINYFNWKREIADVMFAFAELIDHLANAERTGGFELAAALLQRVGRNHRDHETPHERVIVVTMALPNHDFDVAMSKRRGGDCRVTITGLPRYAGFSLSCPLRSRRLLVDLYSDPSNGGVPWRARKLFVAIREDQRAAA
jgi:hypothetical protein